MRTFQALTLFVVSICFSSCYPVAGPDKTFTGAVLGAGWGAGAGAVIGNQTGNVGPGTAIGAGFGAGAGLLTGVGLDLAEGTELAQQRQIDALKVQIAANSRSLAGLQESLDNRDRRLDRGVGNRNIYFDVDRASLKAGSAATLERLAEAIKFNPYVGGLEIHGHSDDTGNTERNLRLSEARARTVSTFLVHHGVTFDRIQVFFHGARRPIATNETESGRQLNRRVEIALIK